MCDILDRQINQTGIDLNRMSVKLEDHYSLSDRDVCSIVRLIGEVAIFDGTFSDKKRLLMNRLAQLIEVDCWIWTPIAATRPGEQVVAVAAMHEGFSEQRFVAYLNAIEHPQMAEFNEAFLRDLQARSAHTTRLRQQLDPTDTFTSSEVFPLWQQADIGPILLSSYPFEDGSISLIGLYRDAHKPLFSERDARIAHVVLSELPWLHVQSLPSVKHCEGQMLSPRLRTTLNLLLEGLGRKQIAGHLGITVNTASGYVKQLYRYYSVQSHPELMKHFKEGDGGDV